jgi:hypothetical protein
MNACFAAQHVCEPGQSRRKVQSSLLTLGRKRSAAAVNKIQLAIASALASAHRWRCKRAPFITMPILPHFVFIVRRLTYGASTLSDLWRMCALILQRGEARCRATAETRSRPTHKLADSCALLVSSVHISPVFQKQPHYRLVLFLDGPHQSSASCPAEHIRACRLHDGRILLSSNRTPYSSAAFTSAPFSRSSRTIDWCPSSTARIRAVLPVLHDISERADCKEQR